MKMWHVYLTEFEQAMLTAHEDVFRSVAASRALVAYLQKRLRRRSEDHHEDDPRHSGDYEECTILLCRVDNEALALTEEDMLDPADAG